MAHVIPTRRVITPVHRAYRILHIGFTVAPILAGADKFFNYLTDWTQYLAPMIAQRVNAQAFMLGVGVIEVLAGLLVLVKPKIGGYVVAAWLAGIIVNLALTQNYYDIALRDFGLMLGALALANIATAEERLD